MWISLDVEVMFVCKKNFNFSMKISTGRTSNQLVSPKVLMYKGWVALHGAKFI
jgi:hypothetical protein